MKILSWNIMQGGGTRLRQIVDAIDRHGADTVVLSETSNGRLPELVEKLESRGYTAAQPRLVGKQTGVLIASRSPYEIRTPSGGRQVTKRLWREVHFPKRDFTLAGLHVPDDEDGIRAFWSWIHRAAGRRRDEAYLFVGDLNAGTAAFDAQSGKLTGDPWFSAMLLKGFTDLWRYRHRSALEYTHYSRAGTGFRLDHAFGSNKLRRRVRSCDYSHEERMAAVSDHSLLTVTIR